MVKYTVCAGDCRDILKTMPNESVNAIITSPPYYNLRDYNNSNQIGVEKTVSEYVKSITDVFHEAKRVLRNDGTLWLNIGDSYGKRKQLIGVPWRVAFSLQADGWILRQDIIWHKKNPMPESVKDRCTRSHEYLFMFSKSQKYYFDNNGIKEDCTLKARQREKRNGESSEDMKRSGRCTCCGSDGIKRNKRDVWSVATASYHGCHAAVFPPDLIAPCVIAGCPPGGVILDMFGGSGTTAGVAIALNRSAILCELNNDYISLIPERVDSILNKFGDNNG
ncbi:TPA: site-specific DNA-methyltransferase [Escherichia coli]|nr:site-specific DNA-methyltransferase [Escherichia coli]